MLVSIISMWRDTRYKNVDMYVDKDLAANAAAAW